MCLKFDFEIFDRSLDLSLSFFSLSLFLSLSLFHGQ